MVLTGGGGNVDVAIVMYDVVWNVKELEESVVVQCNHKW
jgi:hypothetical protein